MPCPWFQNGMCTSPRLPEATSAVVNPSRCLGPEEEYRSCEYFVEPRQSEARRGLEAFAKPAIAQQLKPYAPIHVIEERVRSKCPYMKVYEYGGGYLVYCTLLGRLLTKSEARICEKHWRTCPIARVSTISSAQASTTGGGEP